MRLPSLDLPLRAAGAAPQTAQVEIDVLDPATGSNAPAWRWRAVWASPSWRPRGAKGRCPYCAMEQRFTLMGRFRLPKTVYCASCQRELYLDDVRGET